MATLMVTTSYEEAVLAWTAFLYKENPAIVAGFSKAFSFAQKVKNS